MPVYQNLTSGCHRLRYRRGKQLPWYSKPASNEVRALLTAIFAHQRVRGKHGKSTKTSGHSAPNSGRRGERVAQWPGTLHFVRSTQGVQGQHRGVHPHGRWSILNKGELGLWLQRSCRRDSFQRRRIGLCAEESECLALESALIGLITVSPESPKSHLTCLDCLHIRG